MSNKEKIIKKGSVVSVHYVGTLENGSEFDNSYKRNEPLKFKVGENTMIPGFENSVIDKKINEKYNIKLEPKDAYGEYNENNIQEISLDQLPKDVPVGAQIQGTTENGQNFLCIVKEIKDEIAYLDLNHPLSGKSLNFDIEIVDVENNEK